MTKLSTKSAVLAIVAIATAAQALPASAQGYTVRAETAPQPAMQTQSTQPVSRGRTDIRDFRFVNTSNSVIQGAWISLAKPRAPWISIELSSPIGPNGTREIGMSGWSGSQCFFDVKVAFDDGKFATWTNVNLCRVTNLST